MNQGRSIAIVVVSCLFAAAAFLAIDRGGLLAWIGVLLAPALLFKIVRRPSPRDAALAVAVLAVWVVSWGATWAWVMSTWESGEVVEIEVDGAHTARVWVLDIGDEPFMYYDAPPDVARRLLAGAPLTMTRDGHVTRACARAARVRDLPEEQVQDLLGRMEQKYEGRNTATTVFYAVLGVERDRVGLLIGLAPCG